MTFAELRTATLHPDNTASAMVLERIGMLFEGHTRSSFWLGDDDSDDWIYGMTRSDWDAWRLRPRARPLTVELVEVTTDNLRAVLDLTTHRSQRRFVAPVSQSLAEALVPPVENGAKVLPWYRAVEADGEIAGFVMLARSQPGADEPWLWQLLVDRRHQRRGIGARGRPSRCTSLGDSYRPVRSTTARSSPGCSS